MLALRSPMLDARHQARLARVARDEAEVRSAERRGRCGVKIISLWQPWATLMALGIKRNETRSWGTSYRGDLVIHAAKRTEWTIARELYNELGLALPDRFVEGVALCIVRLEDIRPITDMTSMLIATQRERLCGDYRDGRYAWVTTDLRVLPTPVKMRGAQGLRDLPDDAFQEIVRQFPYATIPAPK